MSDARPGAGSTIPFLAGSETGLLLNRTQWAATPLGPMAQWPQSLRIAVGICLNSRFPMFVWWGPSLVNIYNDAYIPVLGLKHPTAFGRPAAESWSDIWPTLSPQVDAVLQEGRATWNERVLLQMQRNGAPEDTWFTWSYSAIYGDGGAIDGLFCACTEETAHVHAEAKLARLSSEAMDTARTLRTWFDNAPGFVAVLRGPDFVFEMVNEAYYALMGHRALEGRAVADVVPEARSQGFLDLLEGVYATGAPYVGRGVRLMVEREPGVAPVETFIDFVYQPVRDVDGKVVGIFAQGSDVTEQVRAVEALKDADRQKDEFLATLAHELRNPLAPIRNAVHIMQGNDVAPARMKWARDVIGRQADHMARLIDDLLDVSRIVQGKVVVQPERLLLSTLVERAVEAASPRVAAMDQTLSVELPKQELALDGDLVRLSQVLSNLINNASKFSGPHTRILLNAAYVDGQVRLSVRDEGAGIDPAFLPQIFDLFVQGDQTLDRSQGGLGIGLTLVKHLVELHGGRVAATSAGTGQGTEVTVWLPAQRLAAETAPAPVAHRKKAPPPKAPARILVVDDLVASAETLMTLLVMEGFDVRIAHEGATALRVAQDFLPEVVLLDIGLPGMNGFEVANRLRALPCCREALLIALTGYGEAESRSRSAQAGFDFHMVKPADVNLLLAMLSDPQQARRDHARAD